MRDRYDAAAVAFRFWWVAAGASLALIVWLLRSIAESAP